MPPTIEAPAIEARAIEAPAKGASNKGVDTKVSNSHKQNGNQAIGKPRLPKSEKHNASQWQVVMIPVERIQPSPYQPRLSFDAEEMAELVASVRANGVQQPIIVRTCQADKDAMQNGGNNGATHLANGKDNGKVNGAKLNGAKNGTVKSAQNGAVNPNLVRYELIAGERRLRACKEASRKTIPAILRDDLSDAESAELALLENVQRSNLSVIEEARGYKRLMVQFRMKEERIAKKVGKSVGTIKETIKLLQLPETVQGLIATKKLTATHGHELLALAPYERVCVLVAQAAARDQLTARALEARPLPNVAELKRLGLVAQLDWHTKFDWKNECGKCPHKAYVTSDYNAYCLKPEEWNKKQAAAIELQKQESARIMEEARQQNGAPVEAAKLPPNSYRNLSLGNVPAGCSESCSCRSQAADPHDPTKQYPVCLNPSRLSELLREERKANEDARRQTYLALWNEARDVLKADVESKDFKRLATLLALPVCQAAFCRYVDGEQWQSLTRLVAAGIGVFVPWDDLLDEEKEDGELYDLLHGQLETQAPERYLLLGACLLLAYEANQVTRFGGETPGLDFVLGRKPIQQGELATDNEAEVDGEVVTEAEADSKREIETEGEVKEEDSSPIVLTHEAEPKNPAIEMLASTESSPDETQSSPDETKRTPTKRRVESRKKTPVATPQT